MFKKSLMALAIAGIAFNASAALTLNAAGQGASSTNDLLVSVEGSKNTSSVAIPIVVATASTNTGYGTAEKIRITITGGTLTPSTNLAIAYTNVGGGSTGVANLATNAVDVDYPTLTQAILELGGGDLGFVQALAATDTFGITGLVVAPTSTAAGSAIGYTVEVLSSVGGAVINTVTGTVATYATQYSAAATTTDGIIDVGNSRLTFENATPANKVFEPIAVTLTSKQVDLQAATGAAGTPVTVLTGSFAFLDGDADAKVDTGSITTTTGSPIVSADFTTVTETAAALGTDYNGGALKSTAVETVTLTVDGKTQTLAPQTFSISTSFNYVDAGTKTNTFASTMAGGAWKLNGSSSYIPFLPFSPKFTQSVTVTNTGIVAGAITVDMVANGASFTETFTAVAVAQGVTDITAELKAMAVTNGVTGNAAVTVVVNSPDANIRVAALYYSITDADRGVVAVEN